MVANNCNGACACRAAILALIIPRRATKGLHDDLPTVWVKTVSAILIRQHTCTCTSNCINNPRHTIKETTRVQKHVQSDSDSSLVNSASPSLSSSSPLLGKLTRGSTSFPLRILRADSAMVQMDTTEWTRGTAQSQLSMKKAQLQEVSNKERTLSPSVIVHFLKTAFSWSSSPFFSGGDPASEASSSSLLSINSALLYFSFPRPFFVGLLADVFDL